MAIKSEITKTFLSEKRQQMIAEAAYYRAASRGFCGGDPMTDWLESEAEIDLLLVQQNDAKNTPTEKESVLRRLESALHEWDQRVEEFTVATKDTRTRLSTELHEQIAALAEKRAVARQKLATLRDRSADTWHEMREHTVQFFDELHTAFDRVAARLKQTAKHESTRKESDPPRSADGGL